MSIRKLFLLACLPMLLQCSSEPAFAPKPRAYPRVFYPEKAYQAFDENYCQFTFDFPMYAEIEQDTVFFDEKPAHPCWFNVYIPAFESRLHCSYYPVGRGKSLEQLRQDAFAMVDFHNKKANYIEELSVQKPNGVSGFIFMLNGPAASPLQFYLTDSTRHFLRGALYFNTQVNPDSLAPVYEFVRQDILKMIETFEWRP